LEGLVFNFRIDLESVETKSSVQESSGIFQLIDQLEMAVDAILERQEIVNLLIQDWVIDPG
jgi:flagellar basal body-associated protein FliL